MCTTLLHTRLDLATRKLLLPIHIKLDLPVGHIQTGNNLAHPNRDLAKPMVSLLP